MEMWLFRISYIFGQRSKKCEYVNQQTKITKYVYGLLFVEQSEVRGAVCVCVFD